MLPKIPHILRGEKRHTQRRDIGISEFYFENLAKLWNNS
jgi:hypothetical protein